MEINSIEGTLDIMDNILNIITQANLEDIKRILASIELKKHCNKKQEIEIRNYLNQISSKEFFYTLIFLQDVLLSIASLEEDLLTLSYLKTKENLFNSEEILLIKSTASEILRRFKGRLYRLNDGLI